MFIINLIYYIIFKQITPDWFGWLHYRTDRLPDQDCSKFQLKSCCRSQCWLLNHQPNLSGTTQAYYPYDTTRSRIAPWDGMKYSVFCKPTSNFDTLKSFMKENCKGEFMMRKWVVFVGTSYLSFSKFFSVSKICRNSQKCFRYCIQWRLHPTNSTPTTKRRDKN